MAFSPAHTPPAPPPSSKALIAFTHTYLLLSLLLPLSVCLSVIHLPSSIVRRLLSVSARVPICLSVYILSICLSPAGLPKEASTAPSIPGLFSLSHFPHPTPTGSPPPPPETELSHTRRRASQSSIQCQTFLVDRRRRCPKLRPGYIAVVVNPVPLSGPQLSAVSNQTLGFLQAYFASLRSCPLVGLISNLHTFFSTLFPSSSLPLGNFFHSPSADYSTFTPHKRN